MFNAGFDPKAFGWIRGDGGWLQYNNYGPVICFSGSFLHYKLV